MLIHELLHQKGSAVTTILEDLSALDALDTLNNQHIGCLLVTGSSGKVTGLLSERDILAHFRESARGVPIRTIMTPRKDLIIARDDDDIEHSMSVMTEHRIRHLPVFDGDDLIGLVSIGDIMKAVSSGYEFETKLLSEYITGSQAIIP